MPEGEDAEKLAAEQAGADRVAAEQEAARLAQGGGDGAGGGAGESLADVQAKLEVISKENETLRGQLSASQQNQNLASATDDDKFHEDIDTEFATSPSRATAKVLDRHLGRMEQARYLEEAAAESVEEKYGKDELFSEVLKETKKMMRKAGIEARTNPETWDIAFNSIRGRRLPELLKKAREEGETSRKIQRERIGGALPPSGSGKPAGKELPVLTSQDKFVADKLGITEQQMAERKMEYQTNRGKNSRGDE